MLGFLTANLVGRTLVEFGENILNRMPMVRPIYKSLKQIFETLFSKSGSSFRRVGLVEFPSPGMWSLVFLSQPRERRHRGAPARDRARRGLHAVHAQPDHRLLLLCAAPRRHRSRHLGRAAMTLLMSAGMVQPGGSDPQKKLAALAETARVRTAHAASAAAAAAGEIIHPARISRIASSRSNR